MKLKSTLLLLILAFTLNSYSQCWKSISAAAQHSFAIKQDGTLWAWGSNYNGELGDGTTTDKHSPVQIGTSTNWKNIATGMNHSFAIMQNGSLWAWGSNGSGPTQIGTSNDWLSIACGDNHTIAIKQDGTLWTWGSNSFGQLGDGTTVDKTIPTQIDTVSDWQSISTKSKFNLAIKQDGTLWAWGENYQGQLGDGSNIHKYIPTKIGIDSDWQSISAGGYDGGQLHSVAIKQDGTLWAWGTNDLYGQLGDGTLVNKNTPAQIGTSNNWKSISAGVHYTLAIQQDGSLWAWGTNMWGELGDGGTIVNNTVPTRIGNGTNWQSIAAAMGHSVAIQQDGSLWTWGWNPNGQLGDGTTTDKNIPTPITCPQTCFANYTADYDNTLNTFTLTVDSATTANAVSYHWDFGDGGTSTSATPSHVFAADTVYNVCMKIFKSSGDSCKFCHSIGKDYLGNIIRAAGFSLNVKNANAATSIKQEVKNNQQLIIFPNPSNGIFTVSNPSIVGIEIFNLLGACIYKSTNLKEQNNTVVDLSKSPAGIYFVKVDDGITVNTSKVVVK